MKPPRISAAAPRFDAVIVGAGPAGAATAILLARAGWAVALVERLGFPRRKVCGECIAASTLPLLDALGLGRLLDAEAGPELRRVTLLRGADAVTADLPAAAHPRHPWGRPLAREALDTALLAQAQAAGVQVLQPASVQGIQGAAGDWTCELRDLPSGNLLRLRTPCVIDAHGSWEAPPTGRPQRAAARDAADLFAFKANFRDSALATGVIHVLALDGGYGGMVAVTGGRVTVAGCLRRDQLHRLRTASPGLSAGEAFEAWLLSGCAGVRQALSGAVRDGVWLAAGPLDPGVRVSAQDEIFRVGNAAGEAHPLLGEGLSMALQSACLLGKRLADCGPAGMRTAASQAVQQAGHAAEWRREFTPRLRLAAAFAHTAMRPARSALLMRLARTWPGLLTRGARWGGKVRLPAALEDHSPSTRTLEPT
jgi:2-polyprenyl-6-methoxyphenol hydroxylase-like FAD-dependent oxidoreductase